MIEIKRYLKLTKTGEKCKFTSDFVILRMTFIYTEGNNKFKS
jgi:hypothetical protein